MTNSSLLTIHDLGKSFGETIALGGISLTFSEGEIHGVLGQNGAGKSTLVKIMTGLYPYGTYEGHMQLDGHDLRFDSPLEARVARVGYVPQEIEIVEELDVTENVLAGHVSDGIAYRRGPARRRCRELLGMLGLTLDPRDIVRQLSTAHRQLIMIARALASDPKILILDEPTTSLSQEEAQRLGGVIQNLAQTGIAIVFITHRVREVMDICDRATILRDGLVVETIDSAEFTEERIVRGMAGRSIRQLFPGRDYSPIDQDVVLKCSRVSSKPLARGGVEIRDVDIDLHRGEILGVAGTMGSGRTELLLSIFGEIPRTGDVILNGRPIPSGSPAAARRVGLGLLTEDRKTQGIMFNMTVAQNATLGSLDQFTSFSFIRRTKEREVARDVISTFSVKVSDVRSSVTHLSGGNQQKLLFGRCLLPRPAVVLLDEPTKGVDVGTRQEIYQHISELSRQGVGLIIVSSELDELLGLCDRIVVLANGRLVDSFRRGEGDEEHILRAATLGTTEMAQP